MPSRSEAQHKLMEAVDHDPKLAEKLHVSRRVAHHFVQADEKDKDYRKRDHVAPSRGEK